MPLLPFAGTKNLNSDTIVDFKSASLGGYSVGPDKKLPDDYEPVFDRCQNKEHNHVSPDGTVDLGTAIFPDSTFCFKYQVHDDVAYNDVALSLCKEILTNKNFKDVYSDPRFPQFNGSRDIFRIKYRLLPKVDELLKKDLPEDIKNSLGEYISKLGLKQLRLSEFEKNGHVTFYFSGCSDKIYENENESRVIIYSPIVAGKKGTHEKTIELIRKEGFSRARIDGEVYEMDDDIELDKNKNHIIEIVVDRVKLREEVRSRLFSSLEVALKFGDGKVVISIKETELSVEINVEVKFDDVLDGKLVADVIKQFV